MASSRGQDGRELQLLGQPENIGLIIPSPPLLPIASGRTYKNRSLLPSKNLQAKELKRLGLFLFDSWRD